MREPLSQFETQPCGSAAMTLASLVYALSLCRSLPEVIATVAPATRAILGADGVCFVLREDGHCHYVEEDAAEPLWKGQRFPASGCVSGWAMLNGETVVIPDVHGDARAPAEVCALTFVRSMAAAPVRPQAPLAALCAYWRVARAPDTWVVEMLQSIAAASATAIGNVQRIVAEDALLRNAEEAARAGERRSQMLLEAAIDHAIYWLDPDGRVTSWNAGAERIKGYHRDEVIGQNFARFFPPEERVAGVPGEALRIAAETGRWEGEGWRIRKDGSRFWSNAVIDAIRDRDGGLVGFVKISRDATERRRADIALRDAAAQLEQRVEERTRELNAARVAAEQANQAKSRFLAAANHDLRQPFQAIALYYDLLNARITDPYGKKVMDGLGQAVAAGQELLSALLDVSTLDAGIPQPVRLPFVIDDAIAPTVEELAPVAAERGVSLRRVPSGRQVNSDVVLLGRVVRNLLTNAIKYTESGGILVGCRRVGAATRIEVWDTGCGIPADKLDSVFDDFVQLDNPERDRRKGLGLGLAIVARTCRLLGCRYGVRSVEGKGSMFWVEIG